MGAEWWRRQAGGAGSGRVSLPQRCLVLCCCISQLFALSLVPPSLGIWHLTPPRLPVQALALMHKGPGLFPRPLHALQQQLEQQQQWVQAIGKGARRHCDPNVLFGPFRAFNMEVEAGVADVALVLCNDKVW